MITLIALDGLSPEAHTSVASRVRQSVPGPVGELPSERMRFGLDAGSLIIDSFALIIAAVALAAETRHRRKTVDDGAQVADSEELARTRLSHVEANAVEAVVEDGQGTLTFRDVEVQIMIVETVIEIRGRRRED